MSRAESRGSRARRNAVRPGASTLDPGPSTALVIRIHPCSSVVKIGYGSGLSSDCPTQMQKRPKIVDRILECIRASHTFCIVGHIRPDGDCVGSQLGLALALKAEGKKVQCWNEDSIPQKYSFLDPDNLFQRPKPGQQFDCVIAADAASFERLGSVGPCVTERKLRINIDHHTSNTRY